VILMSEAGHTRYGAHFLMPCGMAMGLANVNVLRTGMGSVRRQADRHRQ
jgi:hypothetical protein